MGNFPQNTAEYLARIMQVVAHIGQVYPGRYRPILLFLLSPDCRRYAKHFFKPAGKLLGIGKPNFVRNTGNFVVRPAAQFSARPHQADVPDKLGSVHP